MIHRSLIVLFLSWGIALAQTSSTPKGSGDPLRQGNGPIPAGAVAVVDGIPIAKDVFIQHLSSRFARPGSEGEDALSALLDEALVRGSLKRRGLSVSEDDLKKKFDSLDRLMRGRTGKGLAETIAAEGLDLNTFKAKLRNVVGLEKLVPQDLKIPEGQEVKDVHLRAWLAQKRGQATIIRDESKLPPHAIMRVDDQVVTRSEFVNQLLDISGLAKKIRSELDVLIQVALLDRILAEFRISLTPEDFESEWRSRKAEFEKDPTHEGLSYEAMIKERSGWSAARWRRSPAFKLHTGISRIGRSHFSEADLKAAYEKHRSFFGPTLGLAHILIRATDKSKGGLPSYADAKKTAQRILDDVLKGRRLADLARLYSEDPTTRFKGGRLNPFTPGRAGRLPKNLVEAAIGLQVNAVYPELVRTRWGWHIVKLVSKEPLPTLLKVKERLRRLLAEDLFRGRLEKAKITIDARR